MATLSSSTYYEDGNNFRPVTKVCDIRIYIYIYMEAKEQILHGGQLI